MLTAAETELDEPWAAHEFADVELHDARLNRRCQELAVALGQQPAARLVTKSSNNAGLGCIRPWP